MYRIDIVI